MREGTPKQFQPSETPDPRRETEGDGADTERPHLPKLASLDLELKAAHRSPAWIGFGWAAAILFSLASWLGLYFLLR